MNVSEFEQLLMRMEGESIDFKASNLHVIGNSAPIDALVSRAELLQHLHTDPTHPNWIPYRHTYYRDSWGFCAPHRLLTSISRRPILKRRP